MLRYRYKEGFDRLGIVLFALAFAMLWLFVNESYALPAEGSPQAAAIADELAANCRDDFEQALVMLCHERILGGYRWAYYSERLVLGSRGWIYGLVLGVLVVAALWPVAAWVARGFRRGRSMAPGGPRS